VNPPLPVRRPAEVETVDLTAVEARLAEAEHLDALLQWLVQQG
jgi:hypothetical protein